MDAQELKKLIEEKIDFSLKESHTKVAMESLFSDVVAYGVGDVDDDVD